MNPAGRSTGGMNHLDAVIHFADQSSSFNNPMVHEAAGLQIRNLAGTIPHAHFPKATGARRQRFSGVRDMNILIRDNFAAVPPVAFVLPQ